MEGIAVAGESANIPMVREQMAPSKEFQTDDFLEGCEGTDSGECPEETAGAQRAIA